MLCNAYGTPLRFLLSGGQASDISYVQPLLDSASIPSIQRGRPRKRCKWLLADKRYAATSINIDAARYPVAINEAQTQAWLTLAVGSAQLSTAQHHRAHVWLAEREPPDHDTIRQAREKLRRHGLTGLLQAVFETSLFRTEPNYYYASPCKRVFLKSLLDDIRPRKRFAED
jgi:hypothetical protein